MTDIILSGRNALRQIAGKVYRYHYPKEITPSTIRELAAKGALDPELLVSITLFYRASVDPETEIDAKDVMAWLTTCVRTVCDLLAAEEALASEAEAS